MEATELEQLKYPIGKFKKPLEINEESVSNWIKIIQEFPAKMEAVVQNLTSEQLDWVYRPGGWNIRQLVHHCADSHMNSFIRFKLTLTEELPTIKPYEEALWAEMQDYLKVDVKESVSILKGLHNRWVVLLKSLSELDLTKEFVHPEHGRKVAISTNMALYAWHCEHHLAHIHQAIAHKGSFN